MSTPTERIEKYLSERAKMPRIDQEQIHGLNAGHPQREADLLASDIRAVIKEIRTLKSALSNE